MNLSIKATKTRLRVQKHRRLKRQKARYEKEIYKRINELNESVESIDREVSADSNSETDKFDLRNSLKSWAGRHHIAHKAIKDLLAILRTAGFSVPIDSRTLMNTPVKVDIQFLSEGKLWYRGLPRCLDNVFFEINRDISITLDFNFDGLAIFGSSNTQFWPILSAIQGTCAKYVYTDTF